MEPVFLIALSGASALVIGMCGYLANLPTYKRYGRNLLQAISCFALSAVFSILSIYLPIIKFEFLNKQLSLIESIGIAFFCFGWIILLGVSFFAMKGAAFFERSPRLKDALRWRLALLMGKIGKKYFKVPVTQLAGDPPTGNIEIEPLKVLNIENIPMGTMVFIYGPNDLDLRFWSYTFCNSHPNGYSCFISFTCPVWTLLNLDNIRKKLQMLFDNKRFWIIDCYTGLYGLEETASLRGWELEETRQYIKKCGDIFTLHKRIREFREEVDQKCGGTNMSNNRIVLVHNGLNFLSEDEKSIVYYASHAFPLERQVGWIDVFTLHIMSKENYPLLFQRLYEIADLIIELSEEVIDNDLRKFFQVKKCRWGHYTPEKRTYELDLSENNKFINVKDKL